MIRYIKIACLTVIVAIALVSAAFFSYKCIRQATMDAAPEETTAATEAETEATTVPTEETVPEETAAETTAPEETVPVETEAPKVTIDAVPHYHQSEYPDIRYGNGTVATSGSSVAALAMVATYMTDHVYTPADIADYAVQYGGSHYGRLEKVSDLMQIPWKRALNVNEALKAVREGKVAIALMGSRSVFPGGNHFIVLTGVTEDGKIRVLDPDDRDYSAWGVGELLENGFPDGKLIAGYEGAWIYDKSAMPEEPFIYYEEEPERGEPRYSDIALSQDDIKLLAKVVWVEAQGECAEGQQAVAEVALNRIASGDFPNNLHDVIYGQGQFRSVPRLDKAEPFQAQYEAIERAIYGPYILPKEVVYFATKPTNSNVWGQIGGHIFCYGNDYIAAEK